MWAISGQVMLTSLFTPVTEGGFIMSFLRVETTAVFIKKQPFLACLFYAITNQCHFIYLFNLINLLPDMDTDKQDSD